MRKHNVVVIDDDPISLEVLCYSLYGLEGVNCIPFSDSFQAYQFFHHAALSDVSMVISDWKMPMLDGLELFNVIKNKFHQTPYLLVTAALDAQAADTIKELGINDLISKPFKSSTIAKKVKELLGLDPLQPDSNIENLPVSR